MAERKRERQRDSVRGGRGVKKLEEELLVIIS